MAARSLVLTNNGKGAQVTSSRKKEIDLIDMSTGRVWRGNMSGEGFGRHCGGKGGGKKEIDA